jgi:hypothetical protein
MVYRTYVCTSIKYGLGSNPSITKLLYYNMSIEWGYRHDELDALHTLLLNIRDSNAPSASLSLHDARVVASALITGCTAPTRANALRQMDDYDLVHKWIKYITDRRCNEYNTSVYGDSTRPDTGITV